LKNFSSNEHIDWTDGGAYQFEITGSLKAWGQPSARAYLSSAQTIGSAVTTVINMDTENWDIGGDYNIASYKYVAPSNGKYFVSISVDWEGSTNPGDGELYYIRILKNGVVTEDYYFKTGGAGPFIMKFSTIMLLSAGDEIKPAAFQNLGANRYLYPGSMYTYFVVYRLP